MTITEITIANLPIREPFITDTPYFWETALDLGIPQLYAHTII